MLKIKQLKGNVKYQDIDNNMMKQVEKVSKNIDNEEIWFLEHQKIFTAGSSTSKEFIKRSINNIPVLKINRGGKVTFHGPGQLVIYPILNLKKRKLNIIKYIDEIENICIDVFKRNSITLYKKKEKNRGLWLLNKKEYKKIIFIGLRYSKGVIFHGLSINIENDLKDFKRISPCGLDANDISSLKELNIKYNKKKLINELKEGFLKNFI